MMMQWRQRPQLTLGSVADYHRYTRDACLTDADALAAALRTYANVRSRVDPPRTGSARKACCNGA